MSQSLQDLKLQLVRLEATLSQEVSESRDIMRVQSEMKEVKRKIQALEWPNKKPFQCDFRIVELVS